MCKADVEVLWEPGNFQDDGAKRVGVCFASNTDLELWTDGVEQAVIDDIEVDLGAASSGTPPATACRALWSLRAAGAARLWRPGTCG